ncbi:hypothetical protein [Paracoccus endophyticus]|uniref:hypothetical protein n=1 Tax=Paracoccus endophyticus TaxID=2233774 RepID=UPI0013A6B476|nr:hypothetical protein [Paracoccus endophyticus]
MPVSSNSWSVKKAGPSLSAKVSLSRIDSGDRFPYRQQTDIRLPSLACRAIGTALWTGLPFKLGYDMDRDGKSGKMSACNLRAA